MFSMYQYIRTTENYEFDKIRTAGVIGNATNYKNSQGNNVQLEIKFRSPPGYFHHEPPLVAVTNASTVVCFFKDMQLFDVTFIFFFLQKVASEVSGNVEHETTL